MKEHGSPHGAVEAGRIPVSGHAASRFPERRDRLDIAATHRGGPRTSKDLARRTPGRMPASPRLSVNYHLIEACNARCVYCFATFPDLRKRDRLGRDDQEALVDLLVDEGVEKINFAGGEPTLVPNLGPLCARIKVRSNGRCAVSVVTNGARLGPLMEKWGQMIDWVALSVDSANDGTNVIVGRTREGKPYAREMLTLGEQAARLGIRLKCNTVVSRFNAQEDMSSFMRQLAPERWKLLKMLPVVGENDKAAEDCAVTDDEFQSFVERHLTLREANVDVVPEDNEAMTNSYLMIAPDGRFFWHVAHGRERALEKGDPILDVGFAQALRQVRFSDEKFRARGGEYEWKRDRARAHTLGPEGTAQTATEDHGPCRPV